VDAASFVSAADLVNPLALQRRREYLASHRSPLLQFTFLLQRRNVMSEQSRPYEPLTSENAALILVDHQMGLMTGVRDYSTGELKHNVIGLANAAKALKLPIVVKTTARDSMWGPTFPELVDALPGVPIIDRSTVNAFDDPKVAQAIIATGRKKLIFAGISLEVCAAFPAMTAVGRGLSAYVAVDASGTFSETKRQVGLLRMLQAGVILSDYATLMVEILRDNARPEAGAVYGGAGNTWRRTAHRCLEGSAHRLLAVSLRDLPDELRPGHVHGAASIHFSSPKEKCHVQAKPPLRAAHV
jgi:nicotinamidase-related amidase